MNCNVALGNENADFDFLHNATEDHTKICCLRGVSNQKAFRRYNKLQPFAVTKCNFVSKDASHRGVSKCDCLYPFVRFVQNAPCNAMGLEISSHPALWGLWHNFGAMCVCDSSLFFMKQGNEMVISNNHCLLMTSPFCAYQNLKKNYFNHVNLSRLLIVSIIIWLNF